jgi:hypothetical protein
VPGLHVVPQLAPALHDLQLPLPSQTWPVPQVMPGGALVCEQVSVPEVQVYVPGAQVEPQLVPSWLPQDPPAEPAVPPVPAPPALLPPAPPVPLAPAIPPAPLAPAVPPEPLVPAVPPATPPVPALPPAPALPPVPVGAWPAVPPWPPVALPPVPVPPSCVSVAEPHPVAKTAATTIPAANFKSLLMLGTISEDPLSH